MVKKSTQRSKKKADPFYGSAAWHRARGKALAKAGYACQNCGGSVRGKGAARVHHRMPRRKFPELALHPPNLMVLCVPCDNAVHTWDRAAHDSRGEAPAIGADGFPIGSDWGE